MKGFIISCLVIVFVFTLVIINSFCVINVINDLIEKVETIDTNYESYKNLVDLWDKNSFLLKISSSTKETDKIDDMLSAIMSLYKTGDFSSLEEKKSLLINYMRLIKEHERINIDNFI